MNLYQESERGQRAAALLESEMFLEAVDAVRLGITEAWRSAPIRDAEGMHNLKLMDKLLNDLVGYIKTAADTGKMAEIQLEQESKFQKLRKIWK